jgi:hypothetical protein
MVRASWGGLIIGKLSLVYPQLSRPPYSYSTECDREWSFQKLGHTVERFQENRTTPGQLRDAIGRLDMLLYSHTHDPAYVIPGLIDVFREYKAAGVPTVSAHLDRWLWLNRVKDVGKEATWFTEHIFMADGSPEAAELYDSLGLNWHYLKPAVVERDCYMAEPDHTRFPHEIIFTGSRGYHPSTRSAPSWSTGCTPPTVTGSGITATTASGSYASTI